MVQPPQDVLHIPAKCTLGCASNPSHLSMDSGWSWSGSSEISATNDPEIFQRGHGKHKMDNLLPTSFSSSLAWVSSRRSPVTERLKPSVTVPVSQMQSTPIVQQLHYAVYLHRREGINGRLLDGSCSSGSLTKMSSHRLDGIIRAGYQ